MTEHAKKACGLPAIEFSAIISVFAARHSLTRALRDLPRW
ncbi:hypothetical protein B0G76_0595 [Paraburkholderia sp. BL23I1N1]|nr:hypothetical protein B0G76_0595 [Paraburkholderia sp. BL23I1N1]